MTKNDRIMKIFKIMRIHGKKQFHAKNQIMTKSCKPTDNETNRIMHNDKTMKLIN